MQFFRIYENKDLTGHKGNIRYFLVCLEEGGVEREKRGKKEKRKERRKRERGKEKQAILKLEALEFGEKRISRGIKRRG